MQEVSPHDSERIWSRACQTFPNISRAKILEEVVGLRPHRHQIFLYFVQVRNRGGIIRVFGRFEPRVEVEEVSSRLSVVHNYGHCGYGVLSAPGTSQQAISLINNILAQHN